jgi:hypothetical protein
MRLALVLALIVTAAAAPLGVAHAGEHRRVQAVEPDRAFSGPGWRFRDVDNFREQFFRDQQRSRQRSVVVVPQVVVVSPGRCWQAGYWTYQWVPQSYAYDAWVPAQWSPDGQWIEGHYARAWYNGGGYQPLWVEGYWASC